MPAHSRWCLKIALMVGLVSLWIFLVTSEVGVGAIGHAVIVAGLLVVWLGLLGLLVLVVVPGLIEGLLLLPALIRVLQGLHGAGGSAVHGTIVSAVHRTRISAVVEGVAAASFMGLLMLVVSMALSLALALAWALLQVFTSAWLWGGAWLLGVGGLNNRSRHSLSGLSPLLSLHLTPPLLLFKGLFWHLQLNDPLVGDDDVGAGTPGVAMRGIASEREAELAVLRRDEAVGAALPAKLLGDLLLLETLQAHLLLPHPAHMAPAEGGVVTHSLQFALLPFGLHQGSALPRTRGSGGASRGAGGRRAGSLTLWGDEWQDFLHLDHLVPEGTDFHILHVVLLLHLMQNILQLVNVHLEVIHGVSHHTCSPSASSPITVGENILDAFVAYPDRVPHVPGHSPPRVPLVGVLLAVGGAQLLHLDDGQGLYLLACVAEVVEGHLVADLLHCLDLQVRDGDPLGILGDASVLGNLVHFHRLPTLPTAGQATLSDYGLQLARRQLFPQGGDQSPAFLTRPLI